MKQSNNPDENTQTSSLANDIKRNFGIDVGEIGTELGKDILKENILGRKPKNTAPRSKFGRTLEALTNAWWVPAAVYFSLVIAIIGAKVLAKLAGVEI